MVYDTPPLSKSVAIPTLLQSYDNTRSSWYVIYMLTKLFCTFYLAYGTLNTLVCNTFYLKQGVKFSTVLLSHGIFARPSAMVIEIPHIHVKCKEL